LEHSFQGGPIYPGTHHNPRVVKLNHHGCSSRLKRQTTHNPGKLDLVTSGGLPLHPP
jgi:hypothetical protein